MKTQRIFSLICGVYFLSAISEWLSKHFHSGVFLFIHLGLTLLIIPLLIYAVYREKNLKDKSEEVSRRDSVIIFSGIGLMLVFILFHALSR